MTTPPPATSFTKPAIPDGVAALLTLAFLAVLIRTAWLSDDALITLRTVLNATHGFGLRFNILERVQTYTHPLWLAVVTATYYLTSNVYFAAFASSVLLSALAFWMGVTRAASAWQSAVVVIILFFSRAFIDFSTSGLENPLSYVLLAAFLGIFLSTEENPARRSPRRALTLLWLTTSLLYLTRPDDVLLVAPLLALACWRLRRQAGIVKPAAIGLLPAIAWTLFAIVYYGFPFPNTAYAKLAMGIDRSELWTQGFLYLIDSVDRDPLTLTTIAFAVLLALVQKDAQKRAEARALAAGLVIYLLYVVSIGGDFMAGRFLAVPLYGAALLTGTLARGPRPMWIAAGVAFIAIGSAGSHLPLWSNSKFSDSGNKPSGIIDERGVYFRDKSLVLAKRATFREPDWPTARPETPPLRVLPTCGLMGTSGVDLGPYTHLLDECALADPLLAHLPAVYNTEWRTGHYRRLVPAGYRETLETGANQIKDRGLHDYYDHLTAVTRSDRLWTSARLKEIVALNTGKYDRLIDRTFFRHGGSVAALNEFAIRRADGTPSDDPTLRALTQPLAVLCPNQPAASRLDIALDSDDQYTLTFLRQGRLVSTVELGPIPPHRRTPGLVNYTVDIPPRAAQGFDILLVTPLAGDNRYALGHVLLR
jgi:arabinofuranosyltransferase